MTRQDTWEMSEKPGNRKRETAQAADNRETLIKAIIELLYCIHNLESLNCIYIFTLRLPK